MDLPWLGEFVSRGVIRPLAEVMDVDRLDPSDFHTAGWRAAHWGGTPYGVPSQTTPELMFYRKDWFAASGLEPPATTEAVIAAARHLHDPRHGRYGVAWNAARGTALGHTFMMTCAAFGQPIIDIPPIAGGFDADNLARAALPRVRHRPRARGGRLPDAADGCFAARHPVDVLVRTRPPLCRGQGRHGLRLYPVGALFRVGQ